VTTGKIVDASAVAAIIFDEVTRDATLARLRSASLYAPALLKFEVASVVLKKIRARPAEREALIAAHDKLHRLAISYAEVDLACAIGLAERNALTLYDATYLWLAQEFGLELVTLDKRLANAASRQGRV
jgi:predicted nucleic acid-binding protein